MSQSKEDFISEARHESLSIKNSRGRKGVYIALILCVLLAIVSAGAAVYVYRQTLESAQDGNSLAKQVQTACQDSKKDTTDLGDLCKKATEVVNDAPSAVKGDPGPAGAPGASGSNGSNGSNGVSGSPGPQGKTGKTGQIGPAGPTGSPGPSGASGTDGSNGQPGPPGAQGDPGPAGADGANGTNGSDGQTGPPGYPDSFDITILGVAYTCTDPDQDRIYDCQPTPVVEPTTTPTEGG